MHSSEMDLWVDPSPVRDLKEIKQLDYGTNYMERFDRDIRRDELNGSFT